MARSTSSSAVSKSRTKSSGKAGTDMASRPRGRTTDLARADAKERFLIAFAQTGIVGDGLKACGITQYSTIKNWYEKDPEFAEAYDDAYRASNDLLTRAIIQRGVRGIQRKKHTFYKGRLIHTYKFREYSDQLLLAEAKKRMPEYRDRQEMQHSGTVRFLIQFEGDTEPQGEIIDGTYRALGSGEAT